jgi:hypothetical protein
MRFQTFSPLIAGSILGTVSVNPLALMALALIDTVARTFKGQDLAAQGDTCTSCSSTPPSASSWSWPRSAGRI